MGELSGDVVEAPSLRLPLGDHDHVERPAEPIGVPPEGLADEALQPVPDNGPADLAADRDTEPRPRTFGAFQQEDEALREAPLAAPADRFELGALPQPVGRRESEDPAAAGRLGRARAVADRRGARYFCGVAVEMR
jgi:hypothetical protein